ncbi:hypothetical protein [Paraburkholderia phosphatilytica]|uniref:hypothetical protein n=1 Tax=Paraburkholderia phosphatilytica TaxID=2282883 RepID=UPI000E4AF189|nr:hypothetical protein [Paraburkholderia phosphatilytica]
MKVRTPLIAAAALSVALALTTSLAMADATLAMSDADNSAVFGAVTLSASQQTDGNASLDGFTAAALGTDALAKMTGNAGVNIASGALNMQTNTIALATTQEADVSTRQTAMTTAHISGNSIASLGAGALRGASGNFGINVAAGAGNVQINAMIVH